MRLSPVLAALVLTACGGGSADDVDVTNASVAEVQARARAATASMRFQPGEWQTTSEVLEVEVPGVPPELAAQMRERMLARTSVSSCLTPEQAERPGADLFAGQQGNCRFDRFTMTDGRIDSAMTCAGGDSGAPPARILMTGTFDATHFAMENRIEAIGAPGGTMKMRSRVTGRRTGPCR